MSQDMKEICGECGYRYGDHHGYPTDADSACPVGEILRGPHETKRFKSGHSSVSGESTASAMGTMYACKHGTFASKCPACYGDQNKVVETGGVPPTPPDWIFKAVEALKFASEILHDQADRFHKDCRCQLCESCVQMVDEALASAPPREPKA